MKNLVPSILGTLFLVGIALFLNCNNKDEETPGLLTEEEKNDLLHLREEEKLARDVYLYAYDKYGLTISKNISNSEQTHMDKVLEILNYYGLEDPANSQTGVFNNEELQNLYNQLITKTNISLMEALKTGATIEDLDIKDIEEFLERTTKNDITNMYESLMCGSRNHLRAYYAEIIADDGEYSPAYISQSEFDSIINSAQEKCAE